jgi:hypothetical protein
MYGTTEAIGKMKEKARERERERARRSDDYLYFNLDGRLQYW